jgi:hypothetical protein
MNKLLVLLLFPMLLFSQQKERKYHFDYFEKVNIKVHVYEENHDSYFFKNSKDTTYYLELRYAKYDTIAKIFDSSTKECIVFDLNFIFKDINDLKKLSNPSIDNNVSFVKRNEKKIKYIENIEYEHDTINKQYIIHKIQRKDNKKKTIINEHYFIFSKKQHINTISDSKFKDYLIKNYQLELPEDYHYEKTLCLIDGKISTQYLISKIEKIDFDLSFKIK